MSDKHREADLFLDLIRRVDRIEQGTCHAECLKELGLLALRLSAIKAGTTYHELLYSLIGDAQASEYAHVLAEKKTSTAHITQH